MNLTHLSARGAKGFALFPDAAIDLNLEELPEGIIAVVGPIGQGKTTFFEAVPAALYGEWPSRPGSFVDAFVGRDAFLDVTVELDAGRYRARVNVDAVGRATDALLEREALDGGTVRLNDGKVSTFRAAVKRELPSLAVLLASAFAGQKKTGSFARLDRSARRELFAELLGLRHLEAFAATSRSAAQVVDKRLTRLQGLADHLRPLTTPDRVDHFATEATRLQDALTDARQTREQATTAVAEGEAAVAGCRERIALYRSAADGVAAADRSLGAQDEFIRRLTASLSKVEQEASDQVTRLTRTMLKSVDDKRARIENNRAYLAAADAIRAAAAKFTQAASDLDAARVTTARAQATRHDTTRLLHVAEQLVNDAQRREHAAARLRGVPCGGQSPYAGCQFIKDASAAREELKHEALTVAFCRNAHQNADQTDAQAARALAAAVAHQEALEKALRRGQEDRVKLTALEAAEARVADLEADITALRQQADAEADAITKRAGASTRDMQADLERARAQRHQTTDERNELQAVVDRERPAHDALVAAESKLVWSRDLLSKATHVAAALESEVTAFARRREEFQQQLAQREAYDRTIGRLATDLIEWQALARIFGKEGLQTLEIDAAGPGVSLLANDLLETCTGGRFSIELVTQTATTDGSGVKEVFGVTVYDHARGGEGKDLGLLSGGEEVIVEEALRSAIALHLNQRNVQPIRTCWRDETIGALDPDTAPQYVAMLRRLQARGGFKRVYFITHNLEAAALADAQLVFKDGTITTVLPPFGREAA